MDSIAHLQRHRELLLEEYRHELAENEAEMGRMSLDLRLSKGLCWYPLELGRSFYNSLNQYVLAVSRPAREDGEEEDGSRFEYGVPVKFFFIDKDGKSVFLSYPCTVSLVDGDTMLVAVPGESAVSRLRAETGLGVQLSFDETTYRLMFAALDRVIAAKNDRLAGLREILLGAAPAVKRGSAVRGSFSWLNPSQEDAVNSILCSRDVAIVHGPPGTGKTTTLTEAVFETLFRENQVMVCAQSNAAVDWMCLKLIERGIPVLRVGNPVRIDDKVMDCTFEKRFEDHPDYPLLWNVRRAARECSAALRSKNGNRRALSARLRELRKKADELEHFITDNVFDSARVIACTLAGAASKVLFNRHYSTLFIDEAAQALEAASWIAINKADRVVFAGDHCQLPPTVKCLRALDAGLGRTLMEVVAENKPECVSLLTMQYRMNETIMRFSSYFFYDNRLKAAPQISARDTSSFGLPMLWIDTCDCGFSEQHVSDGTGRVNRGEARFAVSVLKNYAQPFGAERIRSEHIDFGLISPYKAQVSCLRGLVSRNRFLKSIRSSVSINTVDGFQGQERDVIIISLVRSNRNSNIGFLHELRRMNVAMTRARYKLVIIGDSRTMCAHPFYKALYNYIEKSGGLLVPAPALAVPDSAGPALDGSAPDGSAPDGSAPDGSAPDCPVLDSPASVSDAPAPDGPVSDGSVQDCSASAGPAMDSFVSGGPALDGLASAGTAPDGPDGPNGQSVPGKCT